MDDGDRRQLERLLRNSLNDTFGAHPWVAASEVDQSAARMAAKIARFTDTPILAVGARTGVGDIDESIELVSIDLPSTGTMLGDLRSAADALGNASAAVTAQVDAWDPDGTARAIGGVTATAGLLAGRPTFGARPQRWVDLEDKLAIERLWTAAGIAVAPSIQVDLADREAVMDAHRRLATDDGCVWAGDNSSGWHGGAQGTFWVPDEESVETTCRSLNDFRRVRVMPFIEGIPCSIHGMVANRTVGASSSTGVDDVAVFQPVEMMTLRDRQAHRFVYGRASTFWRPPQRDHEAMRDAARRIGVELRRQVDFRGVFTLDGVLSIAGFVPTEVNTRYGAALGSAMPTLDGDTLDLYLINLAVVEGELTGVDWRQFERWVSTNLDRNRWASGFLDIDAAPLEDQFAIATRADDGSIVLDSDPKSRSESESELGSESESESESELGSDSGAARMGEIRWGAVRNGGMLLIDGGPGIDTGPPTAPLLVELIEAADRHWSLGLGPLEAARSVR